MIRLQTNKLETIQDAQASLQKGIGVEFGTLPPYLYALYSILPGTNAHAEQLIRSVVLEEMIHICLVSNILNAIGGNPVIMVQTYPGPLPGDIGPPGGAPLTLHLYPFSQLAMQQAMNIEQPVNPPDSPVRELTLTALPEPSTETIGQFYGRLDLFLSKLNQKDWQVNRNQISDNQFFAGQLFAVNNYADANKAIEQIVSEGEGTTKGTIADPLDFQGELAHYYRFGEVFNDKVLTKGSDPVGYSWGPAPLGVDWSGVYPAIADPGTHDFSQDRLPARKAQDDCNAAFTAMIQALQRAVSGSAGALGEAVRAMFDLRMAAKHAFNVPLATPGQVAGPAFLYKPS